MPNVHIVDRYLETVKGLGIKNDLKGLIILFQKKTKYRLMNLTLRSQLVASILQKNFPPIE